jgi:dihydroorotate dehydrogenase
MFYRLARPLLFQLGPEAAHHLAFAALTPMQRVLETTPVTRARPDPMLSHTVCGLAFPNPIGLAAGFDKNGTLPHVWAALGFGFAELGTVTAVAQPGNPAPRLFRLPDEHALINRLGFNNDGAPAVARDLGKRLGRRRPPIPIGLNIGKSGATPIEAAVDDYRASFALLAPHADYVVVNVSSPNTPGLRDLQAEAALAPLLEALQAANRRGAAPVPLLVKVAPDLSDDHLRAIIAVARDCDIAGIVATNTSIDRGLLPRGHPLAGEAGGLSGAPLRERATAVIRRLYQLANGALPIIGVGGIFSAADAYAKIRAGASLVQIYTGLIYEGPDLPRQLCSGLRALLARDGYAHLRDAVGADA